jgi:inhibitor of KinA sporulation pathway (predicted exonuclease)
MIKPCSEITQFPSVLVRLAGRESVACDEFDTFVRPRFNPLLSSFASELTGISQSQVDGAPLLEDAMRRYLAWLESHDLIEFGQQQSDNNDKDDDGKLRIDGLRGGSDKRKEEEEEEATTDTVRLADAAVAPPATPTPHEQQRCRHGNGKDDARDLLFLRHRKVGHWSIATWSDADIGGQLSRELKAKSLPIPTCFGSWVDLKKCFARHYRREPKVKRKENIVFVCLLFLSFNVPNPLPCSQHFFSKGRAENVCGVSRPLLRGARAQRPRGQPQHRVHRPPHGPRCQLRARTGVCVSSCNGDLIMIHLCLHRPCVYLDNPPPCLPILTGNSDTSLITSPFMFIRIRETLFFAAKS